MPNERPHYFTSSHGDSIIIAYFSLRVTSTLARRRAYRLPPRRAVEPRDYLPPPFSRYAISR